MSTESYIINLQDFRTPHSKVFIGRPRGIQVRNLSKIEEIEPKYAKITIVIPDDISSINPSFLEEFLTPAVLKLGESGFFHKFSFVNNGRYKIDSDLNEAVERILREENALV